MCQDPEQKRPGIDTAALKKVLLKVSTEVGDSKSLTVPEIDGYTSSFFNLNCFSELETSIWKWKKYYGQHQFIKYWFDMEVHFFVVLDLAGVAQRKACTVS